MDDRLTLGMIPYHNANRPFCRISCLAQSMGPEYFLVALSYWTCNLLFNSSTGVATSGTTKPAPRPARACCGIDKGFDGSPSCNNSLKLANAKYWVESIAIWIIFIWASFVLVIFDGPNEKLQIWPYSPAHPISGGVAPIEGRLTQDVCLEDILCVSTFEPLYRAKNPSFRNVANRQSHGPLNLPKPPPSAWTLTWMFQMMSNTLPFDDPSCLYLDGIKRMLDWQRL